MERTEEETKRNYKENLTPEGLYKLKVQAVRDIPDNFLGALNVFHGILKSGRFKGIRLLDLGCGATVHSIASASAYFSEIVQCDLLEVNLEELRKWHRGEQQRDWTFFHKTTAQLEGYKDLDEGCKEIENRIRRSVKAIVECDVLSDQVLPPGVPTEYDLIITNYCLECAAPTFESFVTILKRINLLLRPGGGLIMSGYLNGGGIWRTMDGEFNYLTVSQSDIDEALDRAGFGEKEWTIFPKKKDVPWYSFEAGYVIASRKM